MSNQNFDREAFDTALELAKLVRDATGLCCEPLAALTWHVYQELKLEAGTADPSPTP